MTIRIISSDDVSAPIGELGCDVAFIIPDNRLFITTDALALLATNKRRPYLDKHRHCVEVKTGRMRRFDNKEFVTLVDITVHIQRHKSVLDE